MPRPEQLHTLPTVIVELFKPVTIDGDDFPDPRIADFKKGFDALVPEVSEGRHYKVRDLQLGTTTVELSRVAPRQETDMSLGWQPQYPVGIARQAVLSGKVTIPELDAHVDASVSLGVREEPCGMDGRPFETPQDRLRIGYNFTLPPVLAENLFGTADVVFSYGRSYQGESTATNLVEPASPLSENARSQAFALTTGVMLLQQTLAGVTSTPQV